LGTPALDGRVDARYAFSLAETRLHAAQNDVELHPLLICNEATLPFARNDLIRIALANGYDDLVFVDSDQEWAPQWVTELLAYQVDFVGAPVGKKSDEVVDFNVKALEPSIDMNTGLVEVDMVGCGLLRLSRKALRAISDCSRVYSRFGVESRMCCELMLPEDSKEVIGEDNALSVKWRALGGAVYVAPHMDVVHVGSKAWRRNFRQALQAKLAAVALPKADVKQ